MKKISEFVNDCMQKVLDEHLYATRDTLKRSCAGLDFQILHRTHKETKTKLKRVFFQIIENKFEGMDPEYTDEVEFFLDILENFLEKDFKI